MAQSVIDREDTTGADYLDEDSVTERDLLAKARSAGLDFLNEDIGDPETIICLLEALAEADREIRDCASGAINNLRLLLNRSEELDSSFDTQLRWITLALHKIMQTREQQIVIQFQPPSPLSAQTPRDGTSSTLSQDADGTYLEV